MTESAPRRFADRYVDFVNRGEYSALGGLFAADAVFLAPDGSEHHGRAEIGAFYERFLSASTPTVRIAAYFEQGDECAFELEAHIGDPPTFRLAAIDHVTLDETGMVVRLAAFTK